MDSIAPHTRTRLVLLDLLADYDLISTGPNKWRSQCPGHGSKTRSLAIKDVGDKLLIKCYAGCDPLDVLNAVGLRMSDLFEPTDHHSAPAPFSQRIQKNARETLEAIQIPIDVLVIGINKADEGTLTDSDKQEVVTAIRTIHKAYLASGIESPAIQEIRKKLRRSTDD